METDLGNLIENRKIVCKKNIPMKGRRKRLSQLELDIFKNSIISTMNKSVFESNTADSNNRVTK